MRAFIIIAIVSGCGDNLAPPASTDPASVEAGDYYGLKLGAHWHYAGLQTDKMITACEQVEIRACGDLPDRIERAYVRETRAADGTLLKVHWLRLEPGVGVVRIREDSPTGTTVWSPYDVRLASKLYVGDTTSTMFTYTKCSAQTNHQVTQVEVAKGVTSIETLGELREARVVEHHTGSDYKTSSYVKGIGEVVEKDDHNEQKTEYLTAFEPGFASCP